MAVRFSILYHPRVPKEDIPRLSLAWKKQIRTAIEEKLTVSPENFGKPLRQSLAGYRKLRVGDYRIVFRIAGRCVYIIVIQHRSVVYKIVAGRA